MDAGTGGSMGAPPSAGGGASGGAVYAPGTAPTMPESFNQGKRIMEEVDKDVAAMLSSLKKYDTLKESVAPVLGMKTLNQKMVAEEEDKNPWLELAKGKEEKEDGPKVGDKTKTHKGGTVTKTEKGIVHKKADKSVEVNEEADPEVLAWMSRFSKLGNMKGYGR
jgi:hypothetical protein